MEMREVEVKQREREHARARGNDASLTCFRSGYDMMREEDFGIDSFLVEKKMKFYEICLCVACLLSSTVWIQDTRFGYGNGVWIKN